jgi:hypothetical protein
MGPRKCLSGWLVVAVLASVAAGGCSNDDGEAGGPVDDSPETTEPSPTPPSPTRTGPVTLTWYAVSDGLRSGAPRPVVPSYLEASQALQNAFWPPGQVDPRSTPRAAQRAVAAALR